MSIKISIGGKELERSTDVVLALCTLFHSRELWVELVPGALQPCVQGSLDLVNLRGCRIGVGSVGALWLLAA